jgi:DNA repair protein RecN (Recombination protein N)
MLTEIQIKNFAIIDRLQVSFRAGFNVLTGETGAGKSIIIDAVGLLLGDRARPELIRSGADEATVEAVVDITGCDDLTQQLAEEGFDVADELLIRRIVSRSGKNRVYLNGSLATLNQLQTMTAGLMVIYGQHEQQQLQRVAAHLELLDRFAMTDQELAVYRIAYEELSALQERLEQLELAERDRAQRLDLLAFQATELAQANLQVGEDDELEVERKRLLHAEKLASACSVGIAELYEGEAAVCDRLSSLASEQESLQEVDPLFSELAEAVRQAQFNLEDVASRLRDYVGHIVFDPQRQSEVEERLALLTSLKRKYAPTTEELLSYATQVETELEELSDVEASRDALLKKVATAKEVLRDTAAALSKKRQLGATALEQSVANELKDLALERARFVVRLEATAEPTLKGVEQCTFFLSANPGEEPKPLNKVASGGELSRIMLAIRRAIPSGSAMTTAIFDEVDAGIGGIAATKVGEKLQKVAQGLQVLCVTHLPQVAAFADCHYRVEKHQDADHTRTDLIALDGEDRVREMARMLGGAQVTDRTLEHARELIDQSAVSAAR